jgi:hypothetical protein
MKYAYQRLYEYYSLYALLLKELMKRIRILFTKLFYFKGVHELASLGSLISIAELHRN